jgi:hypothetical protein
MWLGKRMPFAERMPKAMLCLGQDQYHTYARNGPYECIDGMHEHGATAKKGELFGNVASHAQAFASGYDDGVSFHW